MPRHTRPRRRNRVVPDEPTGPLTYDQMAADLVARGLASPRILMPSPPRRTQTNQE